jgi:hypothetical protein
MLLHVYKENIPHEEVFRVMQILWINIESRIVLAIWATKYEMLFERSEFIEWFEEFVLRPLSSGRFRALSFDSVFFLAVQKENEWKGGLGRALQKRIKQHFA